MALKIIGPITSSQGELDSAYLRIENYRVDKASGYLELTLAMYPTGEHAANGTKAYLEDTIINGSKVMSPEIYYKNKKIEYPTFMQFPLAVSVIVDVPIYEERIVQIKYKDFDDDGKVIEKTKDAYQPVVVDTKKVTKSKIDIGVILDNNMFEHAYAMVKGKLASDYFDEKDIQDC